MGDSGGRQGRIGVDSDRFLQHMAEGSLTLDLVVMEFWMGVQIDRPGFSLCAAPLESLGPVFQDGRGDRVNKRRSGVYRAGV